jgi:hypothetical protein
MMVLARPPKTVVPRDLTPRGSGEAERRLHASALADGDGEGAEHADQGIQAVQFDFGVHHPAVLVVRDGVLLLGGFFGYLDAGRARSVEFLLHRTDAGSRFELDEDGGGRVQQAERQDRSVDLEAVDAGAGADAGAGTGPRRQTTDPAAARATVTTTAPHCPDPEDQPATSGGDDRAAQVDLASERRFSG